MTTSMSTAQQSRRNAQIFRSSLAILDQAAIGVMLVRSKEPHRALEAMREYAFANGKAYKQWTVLAGWQTFDKAQPSAEPLNDNVADPLAALKAVTSMGNPSAEPFPDKGVFVMFNPHKFIASGNPALIQILKDYSRVFAASHRRLILLCPPSFQLPEELQDDLSILDFDPPAYSELRDTFNRLMNDVPVQKRPAFTAADVDRILANGAGMTQKEFEEAVSRALIVNRPRLPSVPIDDFAQLISEVKTEIVKRSEVLELMDPQPIASIGGLDNLKDWIAKRAMCFSQEARDFGVEPPKGIALIGPPGTGKSAASKAISSVLGIPLLKLDIGRVFQALVGQSEQRVREATRMVDLMAPCVLMIDEADKAFNQGSSGGGDGGVGSRVLGTLLTWMQETKSPVFMVVTANRTENLPSEFLRRGRLDEIFNVTVPNEVERLEILKIHLKKRRQDPETIEGLEEAVALSNGYVAAEIEAAVKDAVIEAFSGKQPVTGKLIGEQFQNMVPLSEAFSEQFTNMAEWAEKNARPASVAVGEKIGQGRAKSARPRPAPKAPVAQFAGRALALDN